MIIAGDFGGTRIKLGLVENGCVPADTILQSLNGQALSEWLPELKKNVESLCRAEGIAVGDLEGMVWALPLIIDPGMRHATRSFGKYEDTMREDFADRVEDLFDLPLRLENDARAAAIGEWQWGAGIGKSNLAMVTLGTGIGTGVIFEGKPLRGRSGMAGNLGGRSITHLGTPGSSDAPPGCIEGQVATWALPERVAGMVAEFQGSALSRNGARIDYQAVFSQAARGDALARQLRNQAVQAWGGLALNLIQNFDLECVVFGGGIMASEEIILRGVSEFVERHAVQAGGPVEIMAAKLGHRAALAGCEWIWNTTREVHV